jgi:uncharacterized protein (TIGR00255 family)
MLKSMTGFGRAECIWSNTKIVIEIKALNSKQLDINARIPNGYREKELDFRTIISNRLFRGKIDFNITVENSGDASGYAINKELAGKYYRELKAISSDLGIPDSTDYLYVVMRMPDVLVPEKELITEEEWKCIINALQEALDQVDRYRISEGKTLEDDLLKRNNKIAQLLDLIVPYEKDRMENLKKKIKKDLYELADKEDIDKNRFEQELVYYQDKLDITEEKVRLKKHCEYFAETLHEPDSQGKKLAFISQEMGREINTLGSKASEANIQKIVVQMKDELEKIKEQLFNIL